MTIGPCSVKKWTRHAEEDIPELCRTRTTLPSADQTKRHGKWYVVIDYHGKRKAKCVGTREAAEHVKCEIEARLALGEYGCLEYNEKAPVSTFKDYSERWLKTYAEIECKYSTVYGYKLLLNRHLTPEFGNVRLDRISRKHVKDFAGRILNTHLSRSFVRRVICLLSGIFNAALDDEILERNPAARILRSRRDQGEKFQPSPLSMPERNRLLEAARAVSFER